MNVVDMRSSDCLGVGTHDLLRRYAHRGGRSFWVSKDNWDILYMLERGNAGVRVEEYEPGRLALLVPVFGEYAHVMAGDAMFDCHLRWE